MNTTFPLLTVAVGNAIAHEEDFFKQSKMPTVAQRLNNPGCLIFWHDATRRYEAVNGYIEFPDLETGWNALYAQCHTNIFNRELTFREFFGGKPRVYSGYVTKLAAKGSSTPLAYAQKVLNRVTRRLNLSDARLNIDTRIVSLHGVM